MPLWVHPMGAEIRPKGAREVAQKAAREPDRAEAHAWSLRMEGYGGGSRSNAIVVSPLCLSKIKSGHIGGAVRRELGGKESARPVRWHARTAHPSPTIAACGRHDKI